MIEDVINPQTGAIEPKIDVKEWTPFMIRRLEDLQAFLGYKRIGTIGPLFGLWVRWNGGSPGALYDWPTYACDASFHLGQPIRMLPTGDLCSGPSGVEIPGVWAGVSNQLKDEQIGLFDAGVIWRMIKLLRSPST